ncbi:rRNA maturation RNase YbeY [Methylococcaceae bacterium HT1]|nr:rRNA maturation RNase YbeY [Methylococcaceae bacterium HT1]TXL17743.1 rRNA maturation RNase YbeY [Methylococcaceae bacterium HT3]TXL22088.1 rRNA maturation RNase YbeY [Methylococcaceae bacterium HT2]
MAVRDIEVQRISHSLLLPRDDDFQLWVEKALDDYPKDAEVLIRIVDTQEIIDLNEQYRHKNGPTNILSFPFEMPEGVEGLNLLGDLVVCAEVLALEAETQKKTLKDHWAHIITHGILHLIAYDHVDEKDAIEMEAKEIFILQQLHINNPYKER